MNVVTGVGCYTLTILGPKGFHIGFDISGSLWSIIHIMGSQLSGKMLCFSLWESFLSWQTLPDTLKPDSVNTDEVPCSVAFHLGLHCMPACQGTRLGQGYR